MPWQMAGQMTDEDLEAVFTYLQSLPPVKNRVPAPVSPAEAAKLAK
jgi:mono/diheme cytochrome c family protein